MLDHMAHPKAGGRCSGWWSILGYSWRSCLLYIKGLRQQVSLIAHIPV